MKRTSYEAPHYAVLGLVTDTKFHKNLTTCLGNETWGHTIDTWT